MTQHLFAVSALLVILMSCDSADHDSKRNSFRSTPPENASGSQRRAGDIYPFDRVITDKKQRTVEAVIVGRTQEEVIFQKKNSPTPNKHHRYAISNLSTDDQQFFNRLPRSQWQGGGGLIVEGLMNERNRITALIAEKQKEKSRTPDAKTRIRALDKEISRLERELRETNLKIKEQQQKDSQGA